jgi:predicted phage baseplate assembly protein
VGADTVRRVDPAPAPIALTGARVWNPFDVTDGTAPEPAAEVIRRAPEAYRFRQLRAVTLADYVRRAEEVEGVSRAAAAYAWTGSWRTVRVTVDPEGGTELDDALRGAVSVHLEAVRLIGEDLELRAPDFVPLEVTVVACVHPDYWVEDVRFEVLDALSSGWTQDGRMGFFHPDQWTFGQELRASQVIGVVQAVPGIDHVDAVRMRRWRTAAAPVTEIVHLRPNEIVLVRGDPDRMEDGAVVLDLRGGRR